MPEGPRHTIGELAELGGVSRRTVRYYVQERLLPEPLGVGRGQHYGAQHLDRLLKVKTLQEDGHSLDEIRRALTRKPAAPPTAAGAPTPVQVARTAWRRLDLATGLELHVAAGVRMPSPGKIEELAAWCRRHFTVLDADEEADA